MNVITNAEACDAITTAMSRLEFVVTALTALDENGTGVVGLAEVLQDINKALELPSSHLHNLVMIDIHGPAAEVR